MTEVLRKQKNLKLVEFFIYLVLSTYTSSEKICYRQEGVTQDFGLMHTYLLWLQRG